MAAKEKQDDRQEPIIDCRKEFERCPRCGRTIAQRSWRTHSASARCKHAYALETAKRRGLSSTIYYTRYARQLAAPCFEIPALGKCYPARLVTFPWVASIIEAFAGLRQIERDLVQGYLRSLFAIDPAAEDVAAIKTLTELSVGVTAIKAFVLAKIGRCGDGPRCSGSGPTISGIACEEGGAP